MASSRQVPRTAAKLFTGQNIWVDPSLPSATTITNLISQHGGLVCSSLATSQVLIIDPTSTVVFEEYCHPKWLPLSKRLRHKRLVRGGAVEQWKLRVMVGEEWVGECIAAGRMLGDDDQWGGYRRGGPPTEEGDDPPAQIHVINHITQVDPPAEQLPQSPYQAPTSPRQVIRPAKRRPSGSSQAGMASPSHSIPATTFSGLPRPAKRKQPSTPDRDESSTLSSATQARYGQSYENKLALAKIFKRDYDTPWEWASSSMVAKEVAKKTGQLPKSVENRFGQWRCRNDRFKDIPEEFQPSRIGDSASRPIPPSQGRSGSVASDFSSAPSLWSPEEREAKRVRGDTDHAPQSATAKKRRPPQPNPATKTVEELDALFRQAHPLALRDGSDTLSACRWLESMHTGYLPHSLAPLYKTWREGQRRFTSFNFDTEYRQYLSILERCIPLVRRGVTVERLSARMAAAQNDGQTSAAVWETRLGNFLRTIPPNDAMSSQERARQEADIVRTAVAKVFKRDYDVQGLTPAEVGRDMAAKLPEYSAGSIEGYYRKWARRDFTFSRIPDELQPVRANQSPSSVIRGNLTPSKREELDGGQRPHETQRSIRYQAGKFVSRGGVVSPAGKVKGREPSVDEGLVFSSGEEDF
ncbi:uncharacterized protein MKK02DRAFT_41905 [Dioszegia hungarica]|uniref:BRCT domain-containing protein n=1 Tax=Dioszegia hungarica TaxID=4972 RepID=A0AA38LXP0_9TREE|nr:uncharacterized protein MKK02DRAFT_41905 [Dioszegia hungarica]KAI9638878.1 hypothetical protein MKK02DRAFT_41905 [Dioszegia hungarica]